MASDVRFITKEMDGKKKHIPIVGRILGREKKKEEENYLENKRYLQLTSYSEQHKVAIQQAAARIRTYQEGYSSNYTMAMENVEILHSLLLKGVDTHDIFQLLMSNPQGAAKLIQEMGLANVMVADAAFNPGRSNLIGQLNFQKSSTPIANLGIIPIGKGLYMGLADQSSFYILIRPNKDSEGVLYPINTLKPTDFSKILAQLGNEAYLENAMGILQKFNTTVSGLIGTGTKPQAAEMKFLGNTFSFQDESNPLNVGSAVIETATNTQTGGGGGDVGEYGRKEATLAMISGSSDLKVSGRSRETLRSQVGGRNFSLARNLAGYAALAYGVTPDQAAGYISGATAGASATARELKALGDQLKDGNRKNTYKFIEGVQGALIAAFIRKHPDENLPSNPVAFGQLLDTSTKLKDQWIRFTSDTDVTSEVYENYESEDEDSGKN